MSKESGSEFVLNVFTLNCWGIPVISKNRKERFEAIARYLVNSQHTIVCLQEVWSEKDFLFLKVSLKDKLPYSHYFYSGVLGSGLCVFSKWLIQDIFFHQWPLNGYIHKVHHGDWFGGKGLGLCRIRCEDKLVNVYCTHLHAEYHVDDIYLAHRVLQAHSAAEFIHLTAAPADVSILAGDLNTGPGDLSYKIITQLPSLLDPFDMVCVGTNPLVKKQSGTCDNSNNSYSNPQQVKKCPDGKRIDHILFCTSQDWEPSVICFGNPLEDRVPGQDFSYSDHNAVTLELKLRPAAFKKPLPSLRQVSKDEAFDETIIQATKVCQEAYTNISKSKKLFLTTGGLILMFLIGSVGFWPNYVIYDVFKIVLTGLCFYYLIMGSLWNKIELNSLKAGLNTLENFTRTRNELKGDKISESEMSCKPLLQLTHKIKE